MIKEYPVTDALRKQVAAQCRVIVHLAEAIAQVHRDLAAMNESSGPWDDVLNLRGRFTASRMESLGDILNGMDAATEDDEWTKPIFEEAHRLWPKVAKDERGP